MNQITPIKIVDAEYILPSDNQVDILLRASPFETNVERLSASAGISIGEIIQMCFPNGDAPFKYINVTIDGNLVYREYWDRVRPKSFCVINVVVVPRGSAVKKIVAVVVAIAAIVIAPILAAPLLSGLGIAAGTAAATAITGVIASGLSIAGSLAVNALFPTSNAGIQQSASSVEDQTNPLYSIGGAQNTASPYGAIPVVFGTHRVSPFYAAKSYTELSGDDQYLRLLFCFGYGEIDLSDFKIGETDIASYEGLSYEVLQNHLVNPPTLYTEPVYEEQLSIDLAGADWSERTTSDNIDELSVDVSFPNGVYRYQKSNGNKVNYTVTIETQYREVGAVDWISADDISITSSSAQPYRRGVYVSVANGQYEVRVRKTLVDYEGDDTVAEGVFWTALRGRRNDSVVNFDKPLTLVAMRVKATNELSSVINTFNAIAKPKITSWAVPPWGDDAAWYDGQTTENPADHFRYVLQGDANARPVADAQIDLSSLQEWHDYCVLNGFTYNINKNERQSVYATLQSIASAGRAAVSQRDGKWGVVWDEDDDLIVQHFSPRNSADFESTRAYLDMPHGFRVSFINKDNNYLSDERTVYADGYDETNATEFEGLSFEGITGPDLIWKHGRYHLAQLLLQREAYSLVVDFENLVCTRGDRVRVNHDVTMWGAGAGRVKSVTSSPDTVTIDDTFNMVAGTNYSIRFRLSDGTSIVRNVTGVDGESNTLTLDGSGDLPDVDDLAMFGEVNAESVILRVKSIQPRADLTALLQLVDDAPEIKLADQGEIPAFSTGIKAPIDYLRSPPRNILIMESLQSTIPARSKFSVSWQAPEIGIPQNYTLQISKTGSDNWSPSASTTATNHIFDDLEKGSYTVRIAAIFPNGQISTYLEKTQSAVIFANATGDVDQFKISVLSSSSNLSWAASSDPAVSYYQVRYSPLLVGASWATASILRTNVISTFVDVPTLKGTYFIKAVTHSNLLSLNAMSVVNSIDPLNAFNVIDVVEDAPNFDGELDRTRSNSGIVSLDYAGDVFSASDWQDLVTSDISGRAFEFRAKLESFQFDVNVEVTSLEIAIDMEDRVLAGNDVTIPIAGKSITFNPAYRELEGVAIAAQGLVTGDFYEITAKTKTGFTVQFKDSSGTPIERSMDYVAKGYGVINA